MKRILVWVLLSASPLLAAVRFANPAATGSANGSSWANGYATVAQINTAMSGWAAGDTLCMAAGTYSSGTSEIFVTKSGTSGNPITFKRALASDSVCGSTTSGWSSGFDGLVTVGGFLISHLGTATNFITIEGGVPNGLLMMVPNTTGSESAINVEGPSDSVFIHNVEIGQTGCSTSGCNQNGDSRAIDMNIFTGGNYALQSNWLIDHVYMHGQCTIMWAANSSNLIVQYSKFADSIDNTPGNPNCHPNVMAAQDAVNATFRYNEVTNWQVEGIMVFNTNSSAWNVYGNVWHDPHSGSFPRVFEVQQQTIGPIIAYNNTFVNIPFATFTTSAAGVYSAGSAGLNNIYISSSGSGLPSNDYDACNGTTCGETHGQNIATSIFANFSAGTVAGYELASHTAAGSALSSPFNTDMLGNTRGANGVWDRGAFQLAPTSSTWYIRLDGGTAAQCTGHANAAYSGSGSAQPCALNHPFWLMDFSGAWRSDFLGGDTVQFEDQGPYDIGEKNGSLGTDWNALGFGAICGGASSGTNSACSLPRGFPSGTSGNPTKWYGANVGSCHTPDGSNLLNPTVFQPVSAPFYMFSVEGASWGDIECIDIAPTDTCTSAGGSAGGQCTSSSNFSVHGFEIEYLQGQGPSNYILKDIGVHGMSAQGVLGSHINQLPGDFFTASYIFIRGNGMAGWDSDGGGCGTSCESVGTITLSHMYVDFNGCVQNGTTGGYNSTTHTWQNGYTFCYDDSTGGYGDGLSFIAAGDLIFNIDHSIIRWNTQDCYDLLHLGDDPTHIQTINVTDNYSEGCEGQTFKIGGVADVNAFNNISIDNCRILDTPSIFPMTLNPAGYRNFGDVCRASGDQWGLNLSDGHTIMLYHNTTLGYSATMYDIECSSTCTGTDKLVFQDNISVGYADPVSGIFAAGFFIAPGLPDPFSNAGSAVTNNLWFNLRGNTCPQDGSETAAICTNPFLTAQSDINFIIPTLTSSSSAIGKGITKGLTTDYAGNPFSIPPAIGAFELMGAPTPPTPLNFGGNIHLGKLGIH